MTGRNLLLQRVFGFLYVLAGVAKFFPQIESVEDRLNESADANEGSFMEGPTDLLADHPTFVMWLVAVSMTAAGAAMLWNRRGLVIASLYGQLLLLCCLVAVLVQSQPEILVLDAIFFAAAIYLLLRYRRESPAVTPTAP